jgi:hypothetical protein
MGRNDWKKAAQAAYPIDFIAESWLRGPATNFIYSLQFKDLGPLPGAVDKTLRARGVAEWPLGGGKMF